MNYKKVIFITLSIVLIGYLFVLISFEKRKVDLLQEENENLNVLIDSYETRFSLASRTEEFIENLHDGTHLDFFTEKAYENALLEGAEMDLSGEIYDELLSELNFHLCTFVTEKEKGLISTCIYSITSFQNQTLLIGNTLLQVDVLWVLEDNQLKVDEFNYKVLENDPMEEGANT